MESWRLKLEALCKLNRSEFNEIFQNSEFSISRLEELTKKNIFWFIVIDENSQF